MKKPLLYVVSQPWYVEPFEDLVILTDKLQMADIVLFTGGSDVCPDLYSQNKGRYTSYDKNRDIREAEIFATIQDFGIPSLGICRGSQFLTVMAGGSLVQHVSGHGHNHEVFTKRNTVVLSSTHHQMMNPFNLDKDQYDLLGWSEGISGTYLDGDNKEIPMFKKEQIEPEIVYYTVTKSLCIQAHPEIMPANSKGVELCRTLFKEYLC